MDNNVKLEIKDDTLTITVDLSKPGAASRTGKSTIIATTRGNILVPGHPDLRLGLNLYRS